MYGFLVWSLCHELTVLGTGKNYHGPSTRKQGPADRQCVQHCRPELFSLLPNAAAARGLSMRAAAQDRTSFEPLPGP